MVQKTQNTNAMKAQSQGNTDDQIQSKIGNCAELKR